MRLYKSILALLLITLLSNAQVNYCNVGPIIANKCLQCHNGKGAAPFNFSDYDGIKNNASLIKKVVISGYMPPWPADTSFVKYTHNKSLTVKEKNIILDWLNNEMPNCKFNLIKSTDEKKEKPDLIFKVNNTYKLLPSQTDKYVLFPLSDSALSHPLYISKFVFKPGNISVIHHMDLVAVKLNENFKKNKMFYEGLDYEKMGDNFISYEFIAGWLPGQESETVSGSFVKEIPKGVNLMLLVHYSPTPTTVWDNSSIDLYTSKESNPRIIKTLSVSGRTDIDTVFLLPANKNTSLVAKQILQKTFKAYSVVAHLHHLAKKLEAFAITPNNERINILKIDSWQFDWQYEYAFEIPPILPANSIIFFKVTYDNTLNNIENPKNPPKDVGYSFRANDEMMDLLLRGQYLD